MNQKCIELTSRQLDTHKTRKRVLPLCLLGTLSSQGTWLQVGHHENPYSHTLVAIWRACHWYQAVPGFLAAILTQLLLGFQTSVQAVICPV